MMKVMVCGLGSMGKRRIRLLLSLVSEIEIMGVDLNPDRCKEAREMLGIQVESDYPKALASFIPDAVFVCSPPKTHTDAVLLALENGAHSFSEINLVQDRYAEIVQKAESRGLCAFLSSTALYKKEMEWICQIRRDYRKVSYRYHVGQYLADWHPWESYKDFFVADKSTNAVKEIMAIEFPWLFKAFGELVDFKKMETRISQLDLDYPDTLHLILEHKDGTIGNMTIDCVSIKAVRSLQIYSDKCYIQWEGTPDSLAQYLEKDKKMDLISLYDAVQTQENYESYIIENPYLEEIKEFMSAIKDTGYQPRYGYDDDRRVIQWINMIQEGRTNENQQS